MHFGERIRQAREIRGLTQEELAEILDRHKSLLAQVEAGFRFPTAEFLEAVAFHTQLPLAFFNEEPHSEFPVSEVLFRAPRAIKRRQVLDSVRYAEHIYSIFSKVSSKIKDLPCRIKDATATPAEAARTLKRELGISVDSPLISLLRPLERAGVVFIAMPKMEAAEAFSVWVNQDGKDSSPVIGYSIEKSSFDRTRLSICHELGHLVMHRSFLRKVHSEIEDEAFAFASEWLMPEAAMRREIIEPVSLTALARLKPIYGVSIAALVRRALELSLITQRHYYYLCEQIAREGWKLREPESLDLPVERPRLFRKIVELVYGEPINYARFAGEIHISAQELRRIISLYQERANEELKVNAKVIKFSR